MDGGQCATLVTHPGHAPTRPRDQNTRSLADTRGVCCVASRGRVRAPIRCVCCFSLSAPALSPLPLPPPLSQQSNAAGLVVISEEDTRTLLIHRLSADAIYVRSGGKGKRRERRALAGERQGPGDAQQKCLRAGRTLYARRFALVARGLGVQTTISSLGLEVVGD